MRKYAKKLHLWLALPFGVILTLVCFSGAVLAFEKEFTQWAYAGLYQVETVGKDRLPVGDIAAKVASSLPDDVRVTGITIYSDPALLIRSTCQSLIMRRCLSTHTQVR